MSSNLKYQEYLKNNISYNKVKVTDLISRINKEKKIEKKRNLALGVAAVSAVTVFGIILLSELVSTWQILGGIIVLIGIYLANASEN